MAPSRSNPVRTCIGCGSRRPAAQLQRLVCDGTGVVRPSIASAGRGAWLCPTAECLDAAVARRAFERAFRRRCDPSALAFDRSAAATGLED